MSKHFNTTINRLNEVFDEEITVSIVTSERVTQGDIERVIEFENMSFDGERVDTVQTTIQFVDEDGDMYAEAIYHTLKSDESVSMIDWVEVIDGRAQGNGIGRALHEELVNHIEDTTPNRVIYSKLENTRLQGVLIDTGFKQMTSVKSPWHKRC